MSSRYVTILETIAASTRDRVDAQKEVRSLAEIRSEAEGLAAKEGTFSFPFERALRAGGVQFICEVKKASPSKGVIAEDFPYVRIAEEYERAGAAAISVLTEPAFFQGRDAYLREIAEAVDIPILRKDFTIDEYQIYEAKLLGASAVLLICALLDDETLKRFHDIADTVGLSCLVEAHDESEVRRAMAAGARIVGVNNRNLKDFTVDVENGLRLRSLVPEDVVFVSESGLSSADDIRALRHANVQAALIGESLMKSPDKARALSALAGDDARSADERLRIKFCGLTRAEDIEAVNASHPDFAGFVFAEGRRRVDIETAAALARRLSLDIGRVGVFVDEDIETIMRAVRTVGLSVVQLHGNEDADYMHRLRERFVLPDDVMIWKAVRVRSERDVREAERCPADLILFDAYDAEARGGTGKPFAWEYLKDFGKPFVLAGGLSPKNLVRAVRTVQPYGVDVSSGIEKDGRKDIEAMRDFMKAAEIFGVRR